MNAEEATTSWDQQSRRNPPPREPDCTRDARRLSLLPLLSFPASRSSEEALAFAFLLFVYVCVCDTTIRHLFGEVEQALSPCFLYLAHPPALHVSEAVTFSAGGRCGRDCHGSPHRLCVFGLPSRNLMSSESFLPVRKGRLFYFLSFVPIKISTRGAVAKTMIAVSELSVPTSTVSQITQCEILF